MPWTVANALALADRREEFSVKLDGRTWTQTPQNLGDHEPQSRRTTLDVYLETATEANVAFYSGKGYEVLGELYPLGVRTWRMYQRKR
jgi:hypothetical protein